MSRMKKILITSVVLVLVFALTGFFVVPPVLKSLLVKKLSEQHHRAAQANDLLKWEALYFNGIDAGLNPLSVHIREISLSRFLPGS
jgi:hypothetical protein